MSRGDVKLHDHPNAKRFGGQHKDHAPLSCAGDGWRSNGYSEASLIVRMASSGKKEAMGPEPTRLRQIALVAEDLERARHLLVYQFLSLFLDMEAEERQTTVLGTEVIYEDPAVAHWGLGIS